MGKLLPFARPEPEPKSCTVVARSGMVVIELPNGDAMVLTPARARLWADGLEQLAGTAEEQAEEARGK
jgi:antitoxin component of MazEF toxin-antitoxin module